MSPAAGVWQTAEEDPCKGKPPVVSEPTWRVRDTQ